MVRKGPIDVLLCGATIALTLQWGGWWPLPILLLVGPLLLAAGVRLRRPPPWDALPWWALLAGAWGVAALSAWHLSATSPTGSELEGAHRRDLARVRETIEQRIERDQGLLDLLRREAASLEGSLPGEARSRLLPLLDREVARRGRGDRLGVAWWGSDGSLMAWAGEGWEQGSGVRPQAEEGPSAALLRTPLFTVLEMRDRARGSGGEGLGLCAVGDFLEVSYPVRNPFLASRSLTSDLSEEIGVDVTLAVTGANGGEGVPIRAGGRVVGYLAVREQDRGALGADWKVRRDRLLSVLLIGPWILGIRAAWRALRRRGVPALFLLAASVSGLRALLLWARIPALWIGAPFSSPLPFASGFLDSGSSSAGEMLISVGAALLVLGPASGVLPLGGIPPLKWPRSLRGAGLLLAAGLAFSAPWVMGRLLRDTSSLFLAGEEYLSTPVGWIWGLACLLLVADLYLLLVPLLVASGPREPIRRATLGLLWGLWGACLIAGLVPSLALPHRDWGWAPRLAWGGQALVGAFLIARPRPGAGRGVLPVLAVLSLMAAGLLAPQILLHRLSLLKAEGSALAEELSRPVDTWATFLLEEVTDEVQRRAPFALASGAAGGGLAFSLWARSPLARWGSASSLSLYDAEGRVVSRFILGGIPVDEEVEGALWERTRGEELPILSTFSVRGEGLYSAAIPLTADRQHIGMAIVSLPASPELRYGGEAALLFLDPESRRSLPLAGGLTISYLPAEAQGIRPGVWQVLPDEAGRLLTRAVQLSQDGEHRRALLSFRPPDIIDALSTLLLMTLLVGLPLLALGVACLEEKERRELLRPRTFRHRLALLLLLFSLIPTSGIGLLGRRAAVERIEGETRAQGKRALDRAAAILHRRTFDVAGGEAGGEVLPTTPAGGVVLDAQPSVAHAPGELGFALPVDSRLLQDLSAIVGQDLLLYAGGVLVTTSRPELRETGLLSPWMAPRAYLDLFAPGVVTTFSEERLGQRSYLVAHRRLSAYPEDPPISLATPLLLRQEQIARETSRLTRLLLCGLSALLTVAVLLSRRVARAVTQPVAALQEGTQRMRRGDLGSTLEPSGIEEFDELFRSFDTMARAVQAARRRLEVEKARVDRILESVGAGVLAVDRSGDLLLVNPRALELLSHDLAARIGRPLDARCAGPEWESLLRWAAGSSASLRAPEQREFTITSEGRTRLVRAHRTPLPGEEGGWVCIFEDVTETVRSQKVLAWGEMARQIAHEIKNPLTPLRLSIQHLLRVHRDGAPDFPEILRATGEAALREIEALQRIAAKFARYAQPPEETTEPVDLGEVIREVTGLYAGAPGPVAVRCDLPETPIRVQATREGLRSVLGNLLENSREAIVGPGEIRVAVEEGPAGGMVSLVVEDTGEGIPPELRERVFDPNFSTRTGGTGLGLALVRRTIEAWGGTITLELRPGGGTRVVVRLLEASP